MLILVRFLLLVMALDIFQAVKGSVVLGEPYPVDPRREDVQTALAFALDQAFPDYDHIDATILTATLQVVNGISFDLTTAVTAPGKECYVQLFRVWNCARPPGIFLTLNLPLHLPCPGMPSKPGPKPKSKPKPKPKPKPPMSSMEFHMNTLRR